MRSYVYQHSRHAKWLAFGLVNLLALSLPVSGGLYRARAALSLNAPPAPISSIEVNTTGDEDNLDPNTGCDVDANVSGEQCSLRAAIQRANALAGDDVIVFNISVSQPNCGAGKCSIFVKKALPDLSTNVSLAGPGATKLSVAHAPSVGVRFRIFNVTSAVAVSFSGLSIERGDADTNTGGGINNAGSATININACSIFANRAAQGGGIFNSAGTVNISNSRLLLNFATGDGGGVYNAGAGNVSLINTLFQGQQAGSNGAGVHNNGGGTVNVTNSSFYRNVAGFTVSSGRAGGIMNAGAQHCCQPSRRRGRDHLARLQPDRNCRYRNDAGDGRSDRHYGCAAGSRAWAFG